MFALFSRLNKKMHQTKSFIRVLVFSGIFILMEKNITTVIQNWAILKEFQLVFNFQNYFK